MRQRFFDLKRMRHSVQVLRIVGVDLPWPDCIGVGQEVERNCFEAQTIVIQPRGLSTQIDLDVVQRLAVGKLSKGHDQELIHEGERLNLVIASVLRHTASKNAQGKNAMSWVKTSSPWFIAVLCVRTQKFISYGVEDKIETRLKSQQR